MRSTQALRPPEEGVSADLPLDLESMHTISSGLPPLLTPAISPPSTPSLSTAPASSIATTQESRLGTPVDVATLLDPLPTVRCLVRARIPTVSGAEAWLHLYENSVDKKDHMAIVFGPHIRSKSLDEPRPGETELDRMVRGAYTGRLYPGRTESGWTADADADADGGAEGIANKEIPIPLVRIHSECYTGETTWSARCDCGEQLDEAARLMSPPNSPSGGIIIYLRQEGRGIGLIEKLKAYNLQDLGNDTVQANLLLRHPADARSYGLATAMLLDLGQKDVRLLTNNPDKVQAVEGPGKEVIVRERVAMVPLAWRGEKGVQGKELQGYLKTKVEKMGHMLDMTAMPTLS